MNKIKTFFNDNFIIKTNKPIISILLFITTIILNSIQYNNSNYIQNKINSSNTFLNIFLYLFDLIGINGFYYNTIGYLFYFILTYLLVLLIETNIGSRHLCYFLIILIILSNFISTYLNLVCSDESNQYITFNSIFCCGSFLLWPSLGFILYIIQKNQKNIRLKITILLIISIIWIGNLLYDKYITYSYITNYSEKICKMFNYHALFFLFGLCNGYILANKKE